MILTPKQQELIDKVKNELKDQPWFNGVCLDNLPTDSEITRDGEKTWITQLILDTTYWDDPNLFN